MNILVTGATGFVGQSLIGELAVRGHTVIPVVRQSAGLAREVIVSDINAPNDLHATLSGCNAVVHLAARVHVIREAATDPLAEFRRVNVEGTLNLARQAAAANVQRFVYISTIKVNGESGLFCERDTPAPQDAYGQSKMEAENGLMAFAQSSGMEIVIIRPPLVYGPGVKGNFASLLYSVRRGIPLPFGAIKNRRSLLALDNLVDFIALCADQRQSPLAANETFLIADDEGLSTPTLLRRVARAYGVKARLLPIPAGWLRFGARLLGKTTAADKLLGSLMVDGAKARELLGWFPVVSMDDQLQKMVRYDSIA